MQKQRARTDAEKEFRRRKILDAARSVFAEFGFQGTKISMITQKASLSPAAFYLYFKNKVEAYRTLSIDGTALLSAKIHSALESKTDDYTGQIEAMAHAYFSFFEEEREYYDIITVHHLGQRDFFEDLDLVANLEEQSLSLLSVLSSIIQKGMETGEFKTLDPWKTAATLWGMMDGVLLMEVRQSTSYIDLDIKTLSHHFLALALSALKV